MVVAPNLPIGGHLECQKKIASFLTDENGHDISSRSDHAPRPRRRAWRCFHAQRLPRRGGARCCRSGPLPAGQEWKAAPLGAWPLLLSEGPSQAGQAFTGPRRCRACARAGAGDWFKGADRRRARRQCARPLDAGSRKEPLFDGRALAPDRAGYATSRHDGSLWKATTESRNMSLGWPRM